MTSKLPHLRREYAHGELSERDADRDPIRQFVRWFQDALAAEPDDPNAMMLATAGADGRPSARVVLLKGVDERGFVFYTNYESDKARELDENPQAALTFYWPRLNRQVRIRGSVERVSREESEEYFSTRPRGSQIGAWASDQSRAVASREALEERYAELAERYGEGDVPCPSFWGGFRIVPVEMELWQGRRNRLHDRLRYRREAGGVWSRERLCP